ncbi:MAG: cupredoxin domain-containing protein [Solirubrobacteraceae bacterium]
MRLRPWKRTVAAALAAGAVLAAGCGGDGEDAGGAGGSGGKASASAEVKIASFKYAPPTVTVRRGGTVTWTNEDRAPHTATVKGGTGFDTDTLQTGKSKRVPFPTAGSFAYICEFHPFMKGTVVVQ